RKARAQPGRQHAMDAAYFNRIDAIHFTLAHDDGQLSEELDRADIVLVGVSRTSKTPTSMYLANRGYKTANVPIVPEVPLPDMLFRLGEGVLIVGLTTSPDRLVQVRASRLKSLKERRSTDYVDIDRIRTEVNFARRLFNEQGWPVIDVTRRSIEETAAAVINLFQQRIGGEASLEDASDGA
ncbi:MAG: kinase/pyrophosphorylase, partial [Alphaproteobacteria bacterium]